MPRIVALLVVSLVVAAVGAPAAIAQPQTTGPGTGSDPGGYVTDCGACEIVQTSWEPQAGGLPVTAPVVVTQLQLRTIAAGTVSVLGVRPIANADTGTRYTITSRGAPVAVPNGSTSIPTRIPLAKGDVIGVALSGGAELEFGGDSSDDPTDNQSAEIDAPGDGPVAASATSQGYMEYAMTFEPDSDGDGFGDDTQDRCPGTAGSDNGCVPAPAPPPTTTATTPAPGTPPAATTTTPAPASALHVLTATALSGHRLSYALARPSAVKLLLQRRRGRRWVTVRKRVVPGAAGTHLVHVSFRVARGERLALDVRTLSGHPVVRRILQPALTPGR